MLDNSLTRHCRDVHGKTKLKDRKPCFFHLSLAPRAKKSSNDNYDNSEKIQMKIDDATQEWSSVSEKNFLEKRPKEKNVTAVCSSSYVTTKSCSNVSSTVDRKLDFIPSQLSCLALKLLGAVGSSEPEHPAESKNPQELHCTFQCGVGICSVEEVWDGVGGI